MSNKELDKLFKNKLTNNEQKPSSDAWNKIAAQTQNKKVVWWPILRIAAAILLLFTIGFVIWQFNKTNYTDNNTISKVEKQDTAKNKTNNSDQSAVTPSGIENNEVLKELNKNEPELSTSTDKTINSKPTLKDESQAIQKVKTNKPSNKESIKKTPKVELDKQNEKFALNKNVDATIDKEPASTNQTEQSKGTTLEFDLSDFSKTAIAKNEATPEDNNKSSNQEMPEKGIKKVLKLMKDLKSEAGIGDLREAKNEIFALNFKKDSNENNK